MVWDRQVLLVFLGLSYYKHLYGRTCLSRQTRSSAAGKESEVKQRSQHVVSDKNLLRKLEDIMGFFSFICPILRGAWLRAPEVLIKNS